MHSALSRGCLDGHHLSCEEVWSQAQLACYCRFRVAVPLRWISLHLYNVVQDNMMDREREVILV
jgi:hypothetical protein